MKNKNIKALPLFIACLLIALLSNVITIQNNSKTLATAAKVYHITPYELAPWL